MEAAASKETNPVGGSTDYEKTLHESINFLSAENVTTKLRGNLRLSLALDDFENSAHVLGLDAESLITVIDLVILEKFSATINKRLVKVLLPRSVVPITAVTKVLSWMCAKQDNFQLMALMMRWLVLIHAQVDDRQALHSLYDVIFYFLQSDHMCPHVCELLYHLTRKEDVRLYRVQALLQLHQKKGAEPYLQGLLSVYKLYCPQLVSMVIPTGRKSFFRNTDRAWADKIKAVLSAQLKQTAGDVTSPEVDLSLDSAVRPPAAKKAKRVLPAVIPSFLPTDENQSNQPVNHRDQLVPFAQIKSFKQLLRNLDKLELPGQLAAALGNRNLQHVLVCYPDPAISLRITYWLDHNLYNEFFVGGGQDEARCGQLLDTLVRFTAFLQESVPVCENFLSVYLQSWNGARHRKQLLSLVTHCRMHSFSDLCDLFLEPLRKLFFCSDVYFKVEILETFTSLLRNLVQVELPRYIYAQTTRADIASSTIQQANRYSIFSGWTEEEDQEYSCLETIQELIRLTGSMCSVALQLENCHPLLSNAAMDFFQLVTGLYSEEGLPLIQVCDKSLVYTQLYSLNPVSIVRLAQLINAYGQAFMTLQQSDYKEYNEATSDIVHASLSQVHVLNEYIMNMCDTLIRSKAFNSKGDLSLFKDVDLGITGKAQDKLTKSVTLYRHPALLCFVRRFLNQTQKENTVVHPDQIKPHRSVFLKYLTHKGLGDLQVFMDTFIKRKDSNTSTASSMNHPGSTSKSHEYAD